MLDFGFDLALRFIKNQMINKHLSSSVFFRALTVSPLFIYLLTLSKMKNSKKIDVDLDWKVQYVIFCSFRQVRIGCFLKVIDFGRIIFNVFSGIFHLIVIPPESWQVKTQEFYVEFNNGLFESETSTSQMEIWKVPSELQQVSKNRTVVMTYCTFIL